MKPKKREKNIPGNPAGPGTEAIKVYRNGKLADSITLSVEQPQMIFYAESAAAAADLYKDLSPEETEAAYLERATRYIVNSSYYHLAQLSLIDLEAAKRVFSDMLENMKPAAEGSKSKFDLKYI